MEPRRSQMLLISFDAMIQREFSFRRRIGFSPAIAPPISAHTHHSVLLSPQRMLEQVRMVDTRLLIILARETDWMLDLDVQFSMGCKRVDFGGPVTHQRGMCVRLRSPMAHGHDGGRGVPGLNCAS